MNDNTRVKFCLLNHGEIVAEKIIFLSNLKIIYRKHWIFCGQDCEWFMCLCLASWVGEYDGQFAWNVATYDLTDRDHLKKT